MNTRSQSKRETEILKGVREEILENVVKKIDFDEFSSPETRNLPSGGFHQHEVVTVLETIPGFNAQLKTSSSTKTATNITINQESSNTTSQQNNFTKVFSQKVCENHCTRSETNEKLAISEESFASPVIRDRVSSDYYSGTDTPAKLNESTRQLSITKPLNNYIAYSSDEELEDWWDQPKTDYTYSTSLTYRDSVTPDRRIGSPNMSRRGLRGSGTDYVASPAFSHVSVLSSASDSLALRSREIPRGDAGVFSDESEAEESHVRVVSRNDSNKRTKAVSSNRSAVRGSRSVFSSTTSSNSTIVKYGLDVDSDTGSDSPPSQFARPIVRRGFTSFLKTFDPHGSSSDIDYSSNLASANSLNGKGGVRMGYDLVSTSAAPSVTTTKTTSRFWEKLNWRREHRLSHGRSYERTEDRQGWKDKLSEWRCHSWTKVRHTSVAVYTSLLFWLVYVSESVRSRIFHRKQRSRGLRVGTANDFKKTSLTVTTTTVMSTRQALVTSFGNLCVKYKSKRKENPFLWLWVPLLFGLLIPVIALYLFRDSTSPSGMTSLLPVWITEYSEKFPIFSVAYSWIHFWILSLAQSAIYIFHFIVSSLFYLLEILRDVLYVTFDAFQWTFNWILNVISSLSYVSSPFSQKALQSSESYWTALSSPLAIIASGLSSATQAMKYVSHSSCIYLADGGAYLGSSLSYMWGTLMWLSLSVWHLILSILSPIWLLMCFCYDGMLFAITGVAALPWKLFMWVSILAKPKGTSPSISLHPPHVTQIGAQPSSEELLEQVFRSPRLLDFIIGTLQEKLDRRGIPEENVSLTIRLNVEAEVNKLRSEIVEQERTKLNRFSASKEEIDLLRSQQERMINQLRDMESMLNRELSRQETDRESAELREHLQQALISVSANLDKLSRNLVVLREGHADLAAKVRSCCDNASLTLKQVEERVRLLLSDIIGLNPEDESENVISSRFGVWLSNYFATKEGMKAELNGLWEKAQSHIQKGLSDSDAARSEDMKQTADLVIGAVLEQIKAELRTQKEQLNEQLRFELQSVLESLIDDAVKSETEKRLSYLLDYKIPEIFEQNLNIGTGGETKSWSGMTLNATVERIVKKALLKYDADKTGMVDHALESGGGSIVSTRCTEGYQGHQAELTLFGYSFYRYSTNTPRSVIQPDRNPGQCYAFKGSQGYIVIQFAGPVRITGFTMEHIPKVLTPSGSIDSAPRDFSVYGLRTVQMIEEESFHFGDFVYDEDGEPLQYFKPYKFSEEYFPYIELRIHSNYGNMQYTCLYRFRVHGARGSVVTR